MILMKVDLLTSVIRANFAMNSEYITSVYLLHITTQMEYNYIAIVKANLNDYLMLV